MVFELALEDVAAYWRQNRIVECADLLIAILWTLKSRPDGFYDCDNYAEASAILSRFGAFWSKVMGSMVDTPPKKRQTEITSYFSPINSNSNSTGNRSSDKRENSEMRFRPVPYPRFDEPVAYAVGTQYLRRAEKEFRSNILNGTEIGGLVSQYMADGVLLDKLSKKALYDLLEEVNDEMKEFGYPEGFEYGDTPKDIVEVQYKTKRTFYALHIQES
mmetsp:Transcript_70210/g.111671  ORF Transcript_70210/g.111671 Transcript_70210/m.111671 type:complete len:217 (+) Transcript_70210:175-825(+)